MALSSRNAPTEALVALVEYALANGYKVGEMAPYGHVHPVHSRNSWHYDRDTFAGRIYGLAADINAASGASSAERSRLALLVPVAQSLGLSVILGLYGVQGAAASHRGHLHVDVGSYSNLGRGGFRTPKGSVVVVRTQRAVNFRTNKRDNLYGPLTDDRVDAVRLASSFHGGKFPKGVRYAQAAVGTRTDNDWGPKSRAAHDSTCIELQRAWKAQGLYRGRLDYMWGPLMEAAYVALRKNYGRSL